MNIAQATLCCAVSVVFIYNQREISFNFESSYVAYIC